MKNACVEGLMRYFCTEKPQMGFEITAWICDVWRNQSNSGFCGWVRGTVDYSLPVPSLFPL
jgi:hypothetical protein